MLQNWQNDKNKQNLKEVESGKLVGSQIDIESTDDKSKVALFVKHDPSVDLKQYI